MKKALVTLGVLGVLGASAYAYYQYRQSGPKFTVTTSPVTRGDVVDAVGATGTLDAVTTVQVGTQVSGTIQALYADYNSLVKKGQVLARLDPSLFQTQTEQARANLLRAQADLERLKVGLDDAKTKLTRAQELSGRSLIPRSDLDTADVNVRSAEAQIRSQEAMVTQAQASLNQNAVNMDHTVITSPIDGMVISRSVDVGQTVAASMQAPVLFTLAADLTKMQVVANLDESDVGRIRPGQHVTFRVDAYPSDTFTGLVSQVRLEPKVTQNVVTYATVINVPNNDLKLKPGMTANVNIEIARTSNVLRVPNTALRFRPTNEMYAALGQTPPQQEFAGRGDGSGGGRRGGGAAGTPAAAPAPVASPAAQTSTASQTPATKPTARPAGAGRENENAGRGSAPGSPSGAGTRRGQGPEGSAPSPTDQAGEGGGGGFGGRGRGGARSGDAAGGGRGGFAARMENMSPEERERMLQRMRERGFDPTAADGGAGGNRGRGQSAAAAAAAPTKTPAAAKTQAATTIDALFGPLPKVESVGRVWVFADNQLKSVRLRLGITDGQATELIEGDLQQGADVVTNFVTTNLAQRPAAAASGNPFLGQGGRGGFPGGGGFGGGGGNRGGGR